MRGLHGFAGLSLLEIATHYHLLTGTASPQPTDMDPMPRRPALWITSLRLIAAALATASLMMAAPARATEYPVTVTDTAGRTVTITQKPTRVALQDGRDINMMALLDRDDPFARVVIWNNFISRVDAGRWQILRKRWPNAAAIPDMGFADDGQINLEELLASKPQLVIAQRHVMGAFQAAGIDRILAQLNIPLLYVDTFNDPVGNAPRSVALIGKVLDREAEAAEYDQFYADHLNHLQDTISRLPDRPKIFVEVKAGVSGLDQCCFTHGSIGWGKLVAAIGARNLGAELLRGGASGDVSLETVIANQPDVYLMTGQQWPGSASVAVPYGYGAAPEAAAASLARLERRPGFSQIAAAQHGQVYGIWHMFYDNTYNIVGLEYLAKYAYPQAFADLDPAETYRTMIANFTKIPAAPILLGSQAPTPGG
jgi:iron complex transport system substrate-binding protein